MRFGDGGGDYLIGYPVFAQGFGDNLNLRILKPGLIFAQTLPDVGADQGREVASGPRQKRWLKYLWKKQLQV